MKLFKEEFKRIASRKIVWGGLLLLILFMTVRLWVVVRGYDVTIDGSYYTGTEAIQKDKELTKKFEGPLTMEKVQNICNLYGFYYYDERTERYVGNYCNKFITERMTNFYQLEENDPSRIKFYGGEEWESNAAPLLDGKVRFEYAYGWQDLRETYSIMILLLSLILLIGAAPVFSEEYTLRTADLTLTTEHGKKRGIWLKMAAAVCFAAAAFLLFSVYVLLLYLAVFGKDGLGASSLLLNGIPKAHAPSSIGGFFLIQLGMGAAGMVLLSAITMAVSAMCKTSFLSVILSLLLFAVPYVWIQYLAPMWIFGTAMTKAVNHFMVSMPLYLPLNWGFAFSGGQLILHVGIAAAAAAVCVLVAYRKYRNYQG